MRNFAIGRLIGLLLALNGIGLAIWFARDAMQRNPEFDEWLTARPMDAAVDLLKPGETTIPFYQTCGISHGEALFLDLGLDEPGDADLAEVLHGLSGEIAIRDSAGNEIESAEIKGEVVQHWNGQIMLTGILPFRSGHYVATIRIDSGAPNLADKRRVIYAKYLLCGLEKMPAMIAGSLAVGTGLIGIVSAACVLPGLLRSGLRRGSRAERAEPS